MLVSMKLTGTHGFTWWNRRGCQLRPWVFLLLPSRSSSTSSHPSLRDFTRNTRGAPSSFGREAELGDGRPRGLEHSDGGDSRLGHEGSGCRRHGGGRPAGLLVSTRAPGQQEGTATTVTQSDRDDPREESCSAGGNTSSAAGGGFRLVIFGGQLRHVTADDHPHRPGRPAPNRWDRRSSLLPRSPSPLTPPGIRPGSRAVPEGARIHQPWARRNYRWPR